MGPDVTNQSSVAEKRTYYVQDDKLLNLNSIPIVLIHDKLSYYPTTLLTKKKQLDFMQEDLEIMKKNIDFVGKFLPLLDNDNEIFTILAKKLSKSKCSIVEISDYIKQSGVTVTTAEGQYSESTSMKETTNMSNNGNANESDAQEKVPSKSALKRTSGNISAVNTKKRKQMKLPEHINDKVLIFYLHNAVF